MQIFGSNNLIYYICSDLKKYVMVFYREFLKYEWLNANEKIVYSYLIYKSLTKCEYAFNGDNGLGVFDFSQVEEAINFDEEGFIDCIEESYNTIAKNLCMTRRTAINVVGSLKDRGIIREWVDEDGITHKEIKVVLDDITKGYYKLYTSEACNGALAIFYSYLRSKSEYRKAPLDTWTYKLAEEFHTSQDNVKKMLSRLMKKGLVYRDNNKHLVINK